MTCSFRYFISLFMISFITACGGGGGSDSSSVTPLPVTPPANTVPTIDAGNNIRAKGFQTVNLAAIGDDSDGSIATISWTQISGPDIVLSTDDTLTPSFIAPNIDSMVDITLEVTVIDDDGASASDTVVITLVPVINVAISIEENADFVEIISGSSGPLTLEADNSVYLENSGYETLIATVDSNDNLTLMSLSDGSTIEVSGLSTVETLLSFVPSISQVFTENTSLFDNQIASLPQIIALANYISSHSDWNADQAEFESLFLDGLEATLQKLDNLSQPVPLRDTSRVSPDVFHIGDELTGKEYSQERFRTKVTMLPSTSQDGSYQIKVENLGYFRWIVGFIDDNPTAGVYGEGSEWSFILPSESGLLARLKQEYPSNTSHVISPSAYPSEINKQNEFGVYSYGLSLFDIANVPTSGKAAGAYWLATSYTILFDAALPLIGKISPALDNADCVEEFFDIEKMSSSTSQGLAQSIASSNVIRDYVKNGDYDQAALEAAILVSEVIINSGTSCLAGQSTSMLEKALKKLKGVSNLLARFNLLAGAVELGIKAPNAVLEQTLGKSMRFFKISNTNDIALDFTASDYVLAPSYGSPHYSTLEDLDEFEGALSNDYIGTCEPGITECKAYTFDDDPPYFIDFTIGCKHPVTDESISCSSAKISAYYKNNASLEDIGESSTVDDDGKIRFSYQVNNIGEYLGEVVTTDTIGGTSETLLFNLQTKRAQPQVSIYRDGSELAYTVENGVLKLEQAIDVTPLNNQTSSRIELEIVNSGYGVANLSDIEEPLSDGFSIDTQTGELVGLSANQLAPGKQTLVINYVQPTEAIEVEDELVISGKLGAKSVHSFVAQNEVNSIVIPLTTQPPLDCSKYEQMVVGNWKIGTYASFNDGTAYDAEMFADGSGVYRVGDTEYSFSWSIHKWDEPLPSNYSLSSVQYRPLGVEPGCVLYDSGFWHSGYNGLVRSNLQDPLIGFDKYNLGGPFGWPNGNYFGYDLSNEEPASIYRKQ